MNACIATLFLIIGAITPLQERVKAHLILSNPQAALQEVTSALQTNPNDKELEELRLVLLCKLFDVIAAKHTFISDNQLGEEQKTYFSHLNEGK